MAIVTLKRTLSNLADSTDPVNTLGEVDSVRKYWNELLVCRAVDHADDSLDDGTDPVDAEEQDAECAIFVSMCHGEPWQKETSNLNRIIEVGDADPVSNPPGDTVTTLYPNHDYVNDFN